MKVEIEIYRGWAISFDTELETFYCHSEQYDRDESKKSFAATKKFIDDFIKDNEKFKPIWVEAKPGAFSRDNKIKLIGIRKDGKFIYENEKGEKKQLYEGSEKEYILSDKANDQYKEEAKIIDSKINALIKEKDSILAKVKGVGLVEYKKSLLNP